MNKLLRTFVTLLLATVAWPAAAQGSPPPGAGGAGLPDQRGQWRDLTPEQREQRRVERRERQEAWQKMTPEERQQLRRDIRDSGEALYPRGRHQRPD